MAVAKLYFIIAGWAVYFMLPRILPADGWGDYLLILGLVSIVNNVIVTGTVQSISRFTARGESVAAQVRWAGLKMQTLLGWGSALLFAATGVVLSFWWEDTGLIPLFGVMSLMVVLYSYYSVFVGSANGTRQFIKQASLDMGYSTLKIFLVLGGGYLFVNTGNRAGVTGALWGLVFTAGTALVASVFFVGRPSRGKPSQEVRPLLKFALALFVFTLLLNLLMRVDLILIKHVGLRLAPSGTEAATFASKMAGRYGTAQVFAFVIMQVLMSLAFVVFPLISRSTFDEDHETTRLYIRQTMRVALMVGVGLAAVFSSKAADIIGVVYPDAYRIGGLALRFLAWGVSGLSFLLIACTILNSAGKTRRAIFTVGATLVLSTALNVVLLYTADTQGEALSRAGLATALAMVAGASVSGVVVLKTFGALLAPLSAVRLMGAAVGTFFVGWWLGSGGVVLTIAQCAGLVLVYGGTLILTRELGADDFGKVLNMLGRGPSK